MISFTGVKPRSPPWYMNGMKKNQLFKITYWNSIILRNTTNRESNQKRFCTFLEYDHNQKIKIPKGTLYRKVQLGNFA